MLKSLKHLALTLPLLAGSVAAVHAQVFTPPSAAEFVYGDHVAKPKSTSCYALASDLVSTGFGNADLYLSGWSTSVAGTSSEFIWQLTKPNTPTSVLQQGIFDYPDAEDIEVGACAGPNGEVNLLVAYYKAGAGHFLDMYEVTNSTSAPVVYVSTKQLSTSATYGRIRMDCHKMYGVAIAWDRPGQGIQTIIYDGGSWSNVLTLSGTVDESGPDVAISHSNDLNVHYVYYNQSSGDITKSVISWQTLLPASGMVSPVVEDVNYVGTYMDSRIVLDCPDHYDVENWAYTYTDWGRDVFVRLVDYHTTPGVYTVSVNSGILGNVPTVDRYKALTPALHYGGTGQIMVGWFNTDGVDDRYIALEMTEDGSTLLNTADYMELPNGFTSYFGPYMPGIAFNKASNPGVAPDNYLYAVYYTLDPSGPGYMLHHAFHKVGNVVFKGEGARDLHPECGPHAAENQALATAAKLSAYPNPFRDIMYTAVSLEEDGLLQLELTDITGRVVWQYEAAGTKGARQVKTDNMKALAPGAYMLTASLNHKRIDAKIVTKQ